MNITPYAAHTNKTWFFVPTVGFVEYDDGEKAVALIWLQLEVGVKWI